MFKILFLRHKTKVTRWKAALGLSDYQVFWMGFGEGILIGCVLGFGFGWFY